MKTAVSLLQELAQQRCEMPPKYDVITETGPDHMPIFEYQCNAFGVTAVGGARSKKDAKQEAARRTLLALAAANALPPDLAATAAALPVALNARTYLSYPVKSVPQPLNVSSGSSLTEQPTPHSDSPSFSPPLPNVSHGYSAPGVSVAPAKAALPPSATFNADLPPDSSFTDAATPGLSYNTKRSAANLPETSSSSRHRNVGGHNQPCVEPDFDTPIVNLSTEVPAVSSSAADSHFATQYPPGAPYVNLLREFCEKKRLPGPQYSPVDETGPPHARIFTVAVTVGATERQASSATKKAARQAAAQLMYCHLNDEPPEQAEIDRVKKQEQLTQYALQRYVEYKERLSGTKENTGVDDRTLEQRIAEYHLALPKAIAARDEKDVAVALAAIDKADASAEEEVGADAQTVVARLQLIAEPLGLFAKHVVLGGAKGPMHALALAGIHPMPGSINYEPSVVAAFLRKQVRQAILVSKNYRTTSPIDTN